METHCDDGNTLRKGKHENITKNFTRKGYLEYYDIQANNL